MSRLNNLPLWSDAHWRPIETYQEGDYVIFWLPQGENGLPSWEGARAFRENGRWIAWTDGGPGNGSDFEFASQPTHWMPGPEAPE